MMTLCTVQPVNVLAFPLTYVVICCLQALQQYCDPYVCN
jgi:hypothetical protein